MIDAKTFYSHHDEIDGPLIRALQDAPRASISALANTIGQPRSAVSARLNHLISSEEIRIIGAVNPSFIDLNVLAHVSVATLGSIEEAARLAQSHEEIVFVSAVSGEYDFVMEVRVRTHDELHTLLAKFRDVPSVSRLSTMIYSRIVRGTVAHDTFEPLEMNAADRVLIDHLQRDGRASYQSLATAVGLSPSAVRARLGRLTQARVLKIAVIEARRLQGARIAMGVGFNLGTGGKAFSRTLANLESVDFAAETVGAFDAVATIAADSPAALFELLDEIREYPAVKATATWTHLRSIKEDYARRV